MLELITASELAPALLTLGVVVMMFVLFARESYPTEVVAMAGVSILLVSGVLPSDRVLEVFMNPAPWTIAAMFILSSGLVRTGALFEVTPLAIFLAAFGILYLRLFAPRLLPDRTSMAAMLGRKSSMKFFTQVVVPNDSSLIGQKIADAAAFKRPDVRVIDVLRADESLRRDMEAVTLAAGDRIVLRTSVGELLSITER